jgi:hypothetical protein
MTVIASSKDPDGLLLQTPSLTAQIAATSSTLTKHQMSLKLSVATRGRVSLSGYGPSPRIHYPVHFELRNHNGNLGAR